MIRPNNVVCRHTGLSACIYSACFKSSPPRRKTLVQTGLSEKCLSILFAGYQVSICGFFGHLARSHGVPT
jgi:hypothetical protein